MPTLLYLSRFDAHGAGPRYRVYQYFDAIRAAGFKIVARPLFGLSYLNNLYFNQKRSWWHIFASYMRRAIFLFFNKNRFDLVLMDGELFPFVPYFIERFFLPKYYVVDQDDAMFHVYDTHPAWLVRYLLSNKNAKIWKRALHFVTSNQYIKDKVAEMGVQHITVLPTVVSHSEYHPSCLLTDPHRPIVIGWIGSPTTVYAIVPLYPVLQRLAAQYNIVFGVIGAALQLPSVETFCVDWRHGWSQSEEIAYANQIDIGIMPLSNLPYERGKGGFKLIKYMACAKPIVASPIGINVEIVEHGVNGFLANTAEEWEKYLRLLIENSAMRKQFGERGREKMMRQYSLEVTSPILCGILQNAYQTVSGRLQAVA